MSQHFVTEFHESVEADANGQPMDLLARLYREIGISAVAAALEAIADPVAAPDAAERRRLPAFLEDMAA